MFLKVLLFCKSAFGRLLPQQECCWIAAVFAILENGVGIIGAQPEGSVVPIFSEGQDPHLDTCVFDLLREFAGDAGHGFFASFLRGSTPAHEFDDHEGAERFEHELTLTGSGSRPDFIIHVQARPDDGGNRRCGRAF